jgi:hypothetical protein
VGPIEGKYLSDTADSWSGASSTRLLSMVAFSLVLTGRPYTINRRLNTFIGDKRSTVYFHWCCVVDRILFS